MKRVFLIGNPRSGTTLFRLMVNSHPVMICPPECGFLEWWYDKYQNWNSSLIPEFIEDLKSSRKIEGWNLDFVQIANSLSFLEPKTYDQVGQIVYEEFAKSKNKVVRVIADKNNYYINHLVKLNKIWPDAKYILIIRDGRDVACSYKKIETLVTSSPYKPKLPSEIIPIAEEWVGNNSKVLKFFSELPENQSLIVKYEDLVVDPINELTKVCGFLGEMFEDEMLQYHVNNLKFSDEPKETLDWKAKTLEEPDIHNIGKYRSELTLEEVKSFNTIAGNMLSKFGYSI